MMIQWLLTLTEYLDFSKTPLDHCKSFIQPKFGSVGQLGPGEEEVLRAICADNYGPPETLTQDRSHWVLSGSSVWGTLSLWSVNTKYKPSLCLTHTKSGLSPISITTKGKIVIIHNYLNVTLSFYFEFPESWNLFHIFSAHSSRTKSERIRNEADTLIANCSSKTQRSQQEASNRLGTRIEDCNSWRADLQTELDNNIRWRDMGCICLRSYYKWLSFILLGSIKWVVDNHYYPHWRTLSFPTITFWLLQGAQ